MPTLSVENYLSLLKRSLLIPEDKLQRAMAEFKSETGLDAGKGPAIQFAKFLIQRELLTPWQNEYLFQGKHKGFFLGKYKLLKLLGTGGMGAVFLAEHTLMCRRVAIKVLPTQRVKDKQTLKQFLDEARAIAALDHPNIIQAYNVDSQDSLYYLVMEYVEGRDLEEHVRDKGPLEFAQAVEYLRQAADGLSHAHGRKMVHRDIKPGNLLLDKHGTIKILDLGLALLTGKEGEGGPTNDETSAAWSVGTNVAGTMDYLSPEQAMGGEPDARGDLYSLGCTLYFLLIGAPPFPSKTMHELLLKHQSQEPEPLSELRPDIPDDLVEICSKLMAKKPSDRYASAAELAEVLADWLEEHGAANPSRDTRRGRTTTVISRPKNPSRERDDPVDDQPTWTSKDNEETTEVWGKPQRPAGPPIALIGGGIAAALVLLVGLYLVLGRSGSSRTATPGAGHHEDHKRRKFVDTNVKWGEEKPPPPVHPPAQPAQPQPPPPPPVYKISAGKFGGALVCDGGVYPKFEHDGKWDPEQMTVEAWVYLNEIPKQGETRRWLVNKSHHEQHDGHWGLVLFEGKVGAYLNTGGGVENENRLHTETEIFQPRVWQHVALTYDGNELKVFYQGDQVAAKTIGKKRNPGNGHFAIGRRADDHAPMEGLIDEVRFYNRALSPEELKSHAQQPNQDAKPAKIDEGLVSHWSFDEPNPAPSYPQGKRALYKLFEDEPEFLSRLVEGDAKAILDTVDKHSGLASCRCTPGQRHHHSFAGLNLPIRENPQFGEYRFLRFAWKKRGGGSNTLQLAIDNRWGHRYHAGPMPSFQPSTSVSPDLPTEWTVVTRDLFQDFGQFNLTGLAFSPSDGELGWYDGIYVARSMADFDQIDAQVIAGEPDWSQAPLSIACGRKDGDVLRQAEGYSVETNGAARHDGWGAGALRSYCWHRGGDMKITIKVPVGIVGTLRLRCVDGDANTRKQKVVVETREIADLENFTPGEMLAVGISAADTADGVIEVNLYQQGAQNAVVSTIEFLPKK